MKETKLRVEYVEASKLNPAKYNPRTWDTTQEEKLTESIKRFGLVDPLIVNSSKISKNMIIGGHFRYRVAKKLGIDSLPVIFVCIDDKEKEKELNLRLNRNTGSWDYKMLEEFDVGMLLDIGFDDDDLASIWDKTLSVEDDGFDLEGELEKIEKPKAGPGEIYRLGRHTLGCGDATDKGFVDRLVGKDKVDAIYLDPPYNISLDYGNGIGTKNKYRASLTKDNKTDEEYYSFLTTSIKNCLSHAKEDIHLFCYCDERYIGMVQDIYRKLEILPKRVCLWIKNNSNLTPLVAFNKVYEPCVYGTRGSPYINPNLNNLNEILNKEVTTGNRLVDDVYDILNIWLVKRLATSTYEHPTQKPATLHEKPLVRCTRVRDKVLDLFGGSGSTLIACESLKRTCITAEIEPVFCDLIIKRYENMTGGKVERIY